MPCRYIAIGDLRNCRTWSQSAISMLTRDMRFIRSLRVCAAWLGWRAAYIAPHESAGVQWSVGSILARLSLVEIGSNGKGSAHQHGGIFGPGHILHDGPRRKLKEEL